jgi:hypothetical protein
VSQLSYLKREPEKTVSQQEAYLYQCQQDRQARGVMVQAGRDLWLEVRHGGQFDGRVSGRSGGALSVLEPRDLEGLFLPLLSLSL